MSRKRVPVTEEQWKQAVDSYELGLASGRALAEQLGVSSATFSREMRRRGATKARRVSETVVELEAFLDRKARERARKRRIAHAMAVKRQTVLLDMIEHVIRTLMAADTDDDWERARHEIDGVAQAVGAKLKWPTRRSEDSFLV